MPVTLILALSANGATEATLRRGEPLVLSVTVTDEASERAADARPEVERDLRELEAARDAGQVQDEEYRRRRSELEARLEAHPSPAGAPGRPWHRSVEFVDPEGSPVAWDLHPLFADPEADILTLAEGGSARAEFGLDPEEVAGIPPGRYPVRARLPVGDAGAAVSGEAVVAVAEEEVPASERERPEWLESAAGYLLRRGRIDEARALAGLLLQAAPDPVGALVLRGEIEQRAGDLEAALRSFEEAEREYRQRNPDAHGPPEGILLRIWGVRRRLEGA